ESSNVLSISRAEDRMRWRDGEFANARQRLYDARAERVAPGRDDKVLASWNGMMLRAVATAAWAFDDDRYRAAAVANAAFIRDRLWDGTRLARVWMRGEARIDGYLEDYANYVDGLLATWQATFDPQWVALAGQVARAMLDEFYEDGAFYDAGSSGEQLIGRPRDFSDNATPSGNSVACDVLLRLAHLTGDIDLARIASNVLSGLAPHAAGNALGYGRLLCAADLAIGPVAEVAISGDPDADDTAGLLAPLRETFLPRAVVAVGAPDQDTASIVPLLADRPQIDDAATAYVCHNYTCQLPTNDPETMMEELAGITGGS
ncbi:MAG TPA: thioredoxin domain-containing protein, partial [Thermomicrobiales bacterium]|nr:thioredoxin domain-containing protein [Thermomicrobiales bacterium]